MENTISYLPFQRISWRKKIAKDYKHFKDSADYFISRSVFGSVADGEGAKGTASGYERYIQHLRDIYASKFPEAWFDLAVNPYKDNNAKGVRWAGKIRPYNIIKPNIDYLRGEYPKRPFPFQVTVVGEDGYDAYFEELAKKIYEDASQLFINEINNIAAQSSGGMPDSGIESEPVADPAETEEQYPGTYKNKLASQADTDLALIMEANDVDDHMEDMFQDYITVGVCASYKDVIRDEVVYERVPPEEIDAIMSSGTRYFKDAAAVVRRRSSLIIDIKDMFYDALTEEDHKKLDSIEEEYSEKKNSSSSMVEVDWYHVTWRTEEKVGILYYPNPITGELEMDEVSEEYVPDEDLGEHIDWFWRSVWVECYRIGSQEDGIYLEPGKVRYSPNYINNLAKTEGPYNGFKFSPETTENTSILKLQIPFLISYVIAHFSMERMIAKGGNKIILMDKNTIPRKDGWTDAKFFQFAESKGWAAIDRSQVGADKSFNQYTVLDTSMYEYISHLMGVMEFAKEQADMQIGLSRQTKANITQQDSVSGTKAAIYQSSIITEMIFADFEKFKLRELKGLLNCSQIANIDGKKSLYTSSEGRAEILNINPEEYAYIELGISLTTNQREADILTQMRDYGHALAQNGMEASTLLELQTSTAIPKLKEMFLKAEQARQKMEQESAERQSEARKEEISLEQQFQELLNANKIYAMHEEYDRKEDLVKLQGDINMAISGTEGTATETDAYIKYKTAMKKMDGEARVRERERQDKLEVMKEESQLRINEQNAARESPVGNSE